MTTRSQSEADKVAAAGFAEVYEPVKPYLDDLDVFLQSQVEDLEPEIQEHVRYVFGHSGKRLRPMLVAYSGWEGPAEKRAADLVKLGSVIELVHLATLVHDDILDEADTRHRQETAAKKFGPAAAVLIGDVLFSHALKLAAEFDTNEICRSVAQATSRVCAGEIAQTYQRGDVNYDRDFYFRVIRLKTAELFEVSCRLGAKVAGYSEAFSEAAGLFGRHLGIAYQIFDDLVDLYADESMIGKTLGTDLDKGKFTLPLLLLLEKLPSDERESLIARFKAGDKSVAADFTSRLHDFPIFDEVVAVFEDQLSQATKAVEPFIELPPVAAMQKIAALVRSQLGRIQ
ncbi:MAG: polyprenyl synthetase family protein [Opitutales bacterium]|jgi:octaprenyl-diphosphate synthase|nr:polyprenyl synthetase family protein [Opitutales bacterium]MDP4644622.1 polyprenyl synthetase family protein [Opitutales bacterium]MDP4776682.1 polyprenyl synthetase family protein [Opitutales bacterium]MDP4883452.1 polyprenyl synthetase family protein [Opitutales bacterium]